MVDSDIKLAKDIIRENENNGIHLFSQIYSFSNENLSEYLSKGEYLGKTALTVGSSLDQVFNLMNYGCSDITVVDVNPFIKYYYELKKATILSLERTGFFRYLCYNDFSFFHKNKLVLNERDYNKIASYLSSDAKLFWDSLYREFEPLTIRKKLFKDGEIGKNNIINNNDYLSVSNYYSLREKIENNSVKFVVSDIQEYNLEGEVYDYMILSNIFDYIFNIVNNSSLDKELLAKYKDLIIKLSNLLKTNGMMFAHYFYNCDENTKYAIIRNYLLNDECFNEIRLKSNYGINKDYDSIMIYTKK